MEFKRLHHGAVLGKAGVGGNPKSVRLIMGNPLTAPVTVLIDERPDGVRLSYDETASLLAPYGNAEAQDVARDLDAKVKKLLANAS